MKRNNRFLTLLLCAVLCACVLTACGAKQEQTADDTGSAPQPAAEQAAEQEATEASESADITISTEPADEDEVGLEEVTVEE